MQKEELFTGPHGYVATQDLAQIYWKIKIFYPLKNELNLDDQKTLKNCRAYIKFNFITLNSNI